MSSAALLGGVFIGVLSALPIINIANCCCLWITGGGMIAVYLSSQESQVAITPLRGAFLGLMAGAIGAVVWLVAFAAIDVVVGPIQQRLVAGMLQRSVDMPPEAREMLEAINLQASSPLRYALGFAFQLFAGVIFSTLGGVLAAIFLRRRESDAASADVSD